MRPNIEFSPCDLEFFAEDEPIIIVPNFSLPTFSQSTIPCLGGSYGPFRPNIEVDVPFWLAVALYKRKSCRIKPPAWLTVDRLQEVLDEEKSTAAVFQPVPFHYLEIAKVLFTEAKDSFGADMLKIMLENPDPVQVKELVEDICKVRMSKICAGLQVLQGPMTVKLNNLSAMECNVVRPFFQGSLGRFQALAGTGPLRIE